jgi:hypothetical protein
VSCRKLKPVPDFFQVSHCHFSIRKDRKIVVVDCPCLRNIIKYIERSALSFSSHLLSLLDGLKILEGTSPIFGVRSRRELIRRVAPMRLPQPPCPIGPGSERLVGLLAPYGVSILFLYPLT